MGSLFTSDLGSSPMENSISRRECTTTGNKVVLGQASPKGDARRYRSNIFVCNHRLIQVKRLGKYSTSYCRKVDCIEGGFKLNVPAVSHETLDWKHR